METHRNTTEKIALLLILIDYKSIDGIKKPARS